jgi:hypothetical protein
MYFVSLRRGIANALVLVHRPGRPGGGGGAALDLSHAGNVDDFGKGRRRNANQQHKDAPGHRGVGSVSEPTEFGSPKVRPHSHFNSYL